MWDAYNTRVVQQFEGDYIEYDQPPHIDSGVLSLSGNVQNRATLEDPERRGRLKRGGPLTRSAPEELQ